MQQKVSVPLLVVVQLFLWLAVDNIAGQSSCNPPCVAGKEQCQQVFNANGQYACVATVSPSTAARPPTSTSNLSPVPVGCRSCSGGQTCEQVLNSDQYHCVDNSTAAATSPTTSTTPAAPSIPAGCQGCSNNQTCEQVLNSNHYHCVDDTTKATTSPATTPVPAGCQACSPTQLCQQVYSSNQYHCVENSTAVAAPAPSTSSDSSSNSSVSVSSSPCNPACSDDETCKQVFNSKQYACQPNKKGTTSSAAVSTPAATAPVTPGLPDPALSNQAASPSTSKAGLSGEMMPQHATLQQLQQQMSSQNVTCHHACSNLCVY